MLSAPIVLDAKGGEQGHAPQVKMVVDWAGEKGEGGGDCLTSQQQCLGHQHVASSHDKQHGSCCCGVRTTTTTATTTTNHFLPSLHQLQLANTQQGGNTI